VQKSHIRGIEPLSPKPRMVEFGEFFLLSRGAIDAKIEFFLYI
jgi:hypothetical protein